MPLPPGTAIDYATRVNAHVAGRLTADATLAALPGGISDANFVTPDGPLPHVVFQCLSIQPKVWSGGVMIAAALVYIVKAQGEGDSYAPLQPLADRIIAALHDSSGNTGDVRVASMVLCEMRMDTDHDGTRTFPHLDSLYDVNAELI